MKHLRLRWTVDIQMKFIHFMFLKNNINNIKAYLMRIFLFFKLTIIPVLWKYYKVFIVILWEYFIVLWKYFIDLWKYTILFF